jgi:hypothetical protein
MQRCLGQPPDDCATGALPQAPVGYTNLKNALANGGRRWRFVGDEATGFVCAVAEGALGRLAAAAEGDGRFVSGNFEFCAARVDQFERAFDDEWAVRTQADSDVGHGESLRRESRFVWRGYFGWLSG